jgi:hypothetical protein
MANIKEYFERRCFMVLPVEAYHIFKLTFLDAAATDVYRDVFVLVAIL